MQSPVQQRRRSSGIRRACRARREPLPCSPIRRSAGTRHSSNLIVASGCGAIVDDALCYREARIIRFDDDRDEFRLSCFIVDRATENGVEICNASVRYPRLLAVDDVVIAVASRSCAHRGDVRSCVRLGYRERCDRFAACHFRRGTSVEGRRIRKARSAPPRVPASRTRNRRDLKPAQAFPG